MSNDDQPRPVEIRGPQGIGGWLIIPLIHLFLCGATIAVIIVFALMGMIDAIFDLDLRYPQLRPDIKPEIFGLVICVALSVGMLGLIVVCIFHFLQKRQNLPAVMITLYCALVVFDFMRALALGYSDMSDFPEAPAALQLTGPYFALGWIMYFARSKRVKATFVN